MDEATARRLDADDALAPWRERFLIPPSTAHDDGRPSIYLCGNSLGCQPKAVRPALDQDLDDWARLGVQGHFDARVPWTLAHEPLRGPASRLVGAEPREVVVMNSLTVNLHLLMLSFYRPTAERRRILVDAPCFPSDVYAMRSQLRLHGHDPDRDLLWLRPREGEHGIRTEDAQALLEREGSSIALVLVGGVNYYTGQFLDLGALAAASHAAGCTFGVDLAHAVGNVPLSLHSWGVDFAAWCSYKYLNAGPGSLAGAFVHARHLGGESAEAFEAFRARPRCEGWWGNDPATRFRMSPEFVPVRTADAWQLSNPPVFALTPVRVSLELLDEAGIGALREKSLRLTGALLEAIDAIGSDAFDVITPRDPAQRGCQLSLRVHDQPRFVHERLRAAGIVCDLREPNVVRLAPTPLYNTFHDCWACAEVLAEAARDRT